MDGDDDFGDFIDDDYNIQNLFVGRKAAYVKEKTDKENNEDIIEELFEKGNDSKQKKNKLKRKTIKQVKGKKKDIVIPELRMEQEAHNIVAVGFKPLGKKTKNLEVGQVLKRGQSESKLPGGQGQEGTGAGGSGGRQRVHSAGVAPGPGGGPAHRHQATGTGQGGAVQEGEQCAGNPQEGAQPVGPGEGAVPGGGRHGLGLGQGHPGRAGWSGAPCGRGAPPGRQGGGGGGAAGQARHLPPGQAGRDGGGAQRPGQVASSAFDRPSGSPPKSGGSTALDNTPPCALVITAPPVQAMTASRALDNTVGQVLVKTTPPVLVKTTLPVLVKTTLPVLVKLLVTIDTRTVKKVITCKVSRTAKMKMMFQKVIRRYSLQKEGIVFSASGETVGEDDRAVDFEKVTVLCKNSTKEVNMKDTSENSSIGAIATRSVPLPVSLEEKDDSESREKEYESQHGEKDMEGDSVNGKQKDLGENEEGEDSGEKEEEEGNGEKEEDIMPPYAEKEETCGNIYYVCIVGKKCKRRFLRLQTLKDHVDSKHTIKNFMCDICPKKYFIKKQLQVHIKSAHGPKDKECHDCSEVFSSTHEMKAHYIKNHKVQTCRKCGFEKAGKPFFNHRKNCTKKQVTVLKSQKLGLLTWDTRVGQSLVEGERIGSIGEDPIISPVYGRVFEILTASGEFVKPGSYLIKMKTQKN